jgi:hypothetical protein
MNVAVICTCLPTMRPLVKMALPHILPSLVRSNDTSNKETMISGNRQSTKDRVHVSVVGADTGDFHGLSSHQVRVETRVGVAAAGSIGEYPDVESIGFESGRSPLSVRESNESVWGVAA